MEVQAYHLYQPRATAQPLVHFHGNKDKYDLSTSFYPSYSANANSNFVKAIDPSLATRRIEPNHLAVDHQIP